MGLHSKKSMLQYIVEKQVLFCHTQIEPVLRRSDMSTKPKYYIVESSALPEVFLKVAEAKRLLPTGEASTVN